jgi:hypothetical protein
LILLVAIDTGMRAIVVGSHAKEQAQQRLQIAYQILAPNDAARISWNQINYLAIHPVTVGGPAEYSEKSDMVFFALPATVLSTHFRT